MIELGEVGVSRKPELHHFFVECSSCGYDLRFDWLDQIRTCPVCGEVVSLSVDVQEFLRKEKVEVLKQLQMHAEQMGKTEA